MSSDPSPQGRRVGFIGLGNMGGPMATNLAKAGYEVQAFDTSPSARDALTQPGIEPVESGAAAVSGSDVIITSLPDGAVLLEVYRGAGGVLRHARKGALLIDTSTVDVEHARTASAEAGAAGLLALDAPVSGGVVGAAAGTLAFMVGGSAEAFAAAAPYFEVLGSRAVHCGGSGAGQAVKLCNNMLLAIQQIGVCEAFALAKALGVEAQAFHSVASVATGACWALNTNCPVPGLVPTSPSNRDYKPGFAVSLMNKDLGLALGAVKKNGVHAELAALAQKIYAELNASELRGSDFSVVYRQVARRSGLAE